MKSGYRYILYFVIVLLIASGLGLFFLRDQVVTFLNDNTGVAKPALPAKLSTLAAKNALDTETLKSAKFLALKNNVINFDFDTICKTPVGTVETVATSSEGEISTSTEKISCRLGNNVPFPLPEKTK